jgi:hypothetical protein
MTNTEPRILGEHELAVDRRESKFDCSKMACYGGHAGGVTC